MHNSTIRFYLTRWFTRVVIQCTLGSKVIVKCNNETQWVLSGEFGVDCWFLCRENVSTTDKELNIFLSRGEVGPLWSECCLTSIIVRVVSVIWEVHVEWCCSFVQYGRDEECGTPEKLTVNSSSVGVSWVFMPKWACNGVTLGVMFVEEGVQVGQESVADQKSVLGGFCDCWSPESWILVLVE